MAISMFVQQFNSYVGLKTMGVYDEQSIQSEVSGIQKYEFEKQCKAAHWVTVFLGGYIWFIVGL